MKRLMKEVVGGGLAISLMVLLAACQLPRVTPTDGGAPALDPGFVSVAEGIAFTAGGGVCKLLPAAQQSVAMAVLAGIDASDPEALFKLQNNTSLAAGMIWSVLNQAINTAQYLTGHHLAQDEDQSKQEWLALARVILPAAKQGCQLVLG